ncbi:cadherin domain-containing protein [Microvirga sp. Mcv34]|uniref:cadherin domain-containing protein n=1 Tax=Microvirga sp. Mcv34 TaxID=2926016 RepID=UPI0021C6AC86|nr:cadherin domain-containing protein [Microvirga sp. Mcv34]
MPMSGDQILTYEGISLPSYWGGNWGTATADVAFDQIRNTGASSVAIIPSFYMENRYGNAMGLADTSQFKSETIAQTRAAMLDVTSRGMNVMLKPHVESKDYTWRAEIQPTNIPLWFQNYKAMMLQYAQLAQETGAPILCIGTEMKSLSGPGIIPTAQGGNGTMTYRDKWAELIDSIRAVYGGKITYAATYDEVTKVSFWDRVDFIGVDAYLPLTTSNTPTVSQMIDAWVLPHTNSWIRDTLYQGKSAIKYYKSLAEQYGKKVLFTEVGYRSMDGANKDPGVWASSGTVDYQEQQDAYQALYHVMKNYSGQWLDGAFLWSYHPFENPEAHGVQTIDYTPQNKPANTVITNGYSSPAHVTGLTWNGTSAADKLDGGYNHDTLNGAAGNDVLWGGAGDDVLNGGSENDTLTGVWGNDTLDGGTGTNTAVFSGNRSNYTLVVNGDGSITVTDPRAGKDGVDTLRNVQFAQFADQTISLTGTTDPNTAPTDIALSALSIDESGTAGSVIGTLSATDTAGSTFTYTLIDDPDSKFQIVNNELQVRTGATLDFEDKGSHQVTIRVTDQGNLTYDETFTIFVNNVNEAPTSLTLSSASIDENRTGGTLVGTLVGVDLDAGSTLTYAILSDPEGKFQILGNQLQVRSGATLDYEAKASHQVTVRVTDQGGLYKDQTFTVVVNNVNEAPTSLTLSNTSIDENRTGGASIGVLTGTDPDAGTTLSYTILNDPDSKFAIVGNELRLRTGATLDYETQTSHQVTVRVTDQGGLYKDQTFTIAVNNIEPEGTGAQAPTDIALSTTSVNEKSTVIGLLSATDTPGDTFTYAVVSDPDGKFQVVGNELRVRSGAVLDYETKTSHDVRIRVTDQSNFSYEKTFTITVNNVNEAPTGVTLSKSNVDENSTGATVVGLLGALDPDANGTYTYALVSDPDAKFQVVGNQLQVRNGASLNYEAKIAHQVTVRVTDQGGLSFDKVLTVAVNNVNEAPASLTLSGTRINENSLAGAVVGTLAATDPDAGSTFTYALVSDPDAKFQVVGNQLQVRANANIDYETKTSHQVTLRVTDQGGLSFDKVFTIAVNNIKNEKIVAKSASGLLKSENYDDTIAGGDGDDTIVSAGGRDILTGGSGKDVFVFNAKPTFANIKKLADFKPKEDKIWLDDKYFKAGKGTQDHPGKLKAAAFYTGKAAHDASDRIIYDKKTGILSYDKDGTGAAAQVQIGILQKNLKLTASDFDII